MHSTSRHLTSVAAVVSEARWVENGDRSALHAATASLAGGTNQEDSLLRDNLRVLGFRRAVREPPSVVVGGSHERG